MILYLRSRLRAGNRYLSRLCTWHFFNPFTLLFVLSKLKKRRVYHQTYAFATLISLVLHLLSRTLTKQKRRPAGSYQGSPAHRAFLRLNRRQTNAPIP